MHLLNLQVDARGTTTTNLALGTRCQGALEVVAVKATTGAWAVLCKWKWRH
jgi:hypothetical protein